jgi:hypothetical protein
MLQGIGKRGVLIGAGAMLLAAAGCTVDVYSPPPRGEVIVEAPPPPSPPPGEVVVGVDQPPPPPVYEAPPPPPEVGVVWVPGDYVIVGGRWEWRGGHYDHPPRGGAHWIGPRYEHGPHGYVRVEGHWE